MMVAADAAGMRPDGRVRYLIDWIRGNLLEGNQWGEKRVIIFTEYEDTLRYLRRCIEDAITHTDKAEERIAVFHGPTPLDQREAIKLAFNEHPSKDPLRILLCNDAAREGLNLQPHCFNLFHFDVPWNPSRLEQRNGRIDRKLQLSDTVYCHYFVYAQRSEDRVLRALIELLLEIRKVECLPDIPIDSSVSITKAAEPFRKKETSDYTVLILFDLTREKSENTSLSEGVKKPSSRLRPTMRACNQVTSSVKHALNRRFNEEDGDVPHDFPDSCYRIFQPSPNTSEVQVPGSD